jgi:hypothetical protein
MALIAQQDVIHLFLPNYETVPERVAKHLEQYPDVRIVSMQVLPWNNAGVNVFIVVETV